MTITLEGPAFAVVCVALALGVLAALLLLVSIRAEPTREERARIRGEYLAWRHPRRGGRR